MKIRLIFTTVAAMFLLLGCKTDKKENEKHNGYFISGTIIGLDNGILATDNDTITVKEGRFFLQGKVDGAIQKYFRINDQYSFLLLLSNETFNVKVDLSKADERGFLEDIDISGSAINNEFKKISDQIRNTPESKKLEKLFKASKKLEKDSEAYKKNEEALSDARDTSRNVRSEFIKNYALKNPNSVVAAYFMQFQANEVDQTFQEYEQIVEGFSEEVKKSSFYKPLKDNLEALKRVAIGKIAPDFTLKTDTDEDFTLSSLRGKIVLVDFWASWCVPCRKSYPHLKKVYEKYKDKGFEVVGVTNDSNHDQWKKAIKEDELEWIQVADIFPPRDAGPPFTARVITSYAAPYLPSTYLLDRDGKILAKQLHGEELDMKLAEIFNK